MNVAADDPQGLAAFQQVLQQLGWRDGRNVQIDIRWSENDAVVTSLKRIGTLLTQERFYSMGVS
jgi:hypothetical protein